MNFYLHAEVKQNGIWDHYDCRNNDAFAIAIKVFANTIRNRGLPEDATFLTRSDCGLFSHSHSWLSAEEITKLTGSVPFNAPEGVEDIRFIFWFV